jgi:hypothetical protein
MFQEIIEIDIAIIAFCSRNSFALSSILTSALGIYTVV